MSTNNKRPGKKKSAGKNALIALILVVVAVAAVIAVVIFNGINSVPEIDTGSDNKTEELLINTDEKPNKKKPIGDRKENFFNFLVIGRDAAASNTDVMMIVSYDINEQKVGILQVPRDSYVDCNYNSLKSKKVNSVFANAYLTAKKKDKSKTEDELTRIGIKGLEYTLEDTFGISIDRYVYMNLSSFKNIVDIIGGVDVDVPYSIKYNDNSQNLHINLKAGYQHLDGDQAEQFVRFRKGYTEGDIGRLDAQKIFLAAVADKLLNSIDVSTVPQLAKEAYDNIVTDMTISDMLYFANQATNLETENITMYTACGEPFTLKSSGASMYSLYKKENLEIINKAFNNFNKDIEASDITLNEQQNNGKGSKDTTGMTVKEEMLNPKKPLKSW